MLVATVQASAGKTSNDSAGGGSTPYAILPSLIWVLLAVAVFFMFKKQIQRLVEGLINRIESGAEVKFGSVELREDPCGRRST